MAGEQWRTETAEQTWTVDGIPVLHATVALPQTAQAPKNRKEKRFCRYYQQFSHSYLRYCEQFLFPQAASAYRAACETGAPLPAYTADLRYELTLQREGLVSLYTESCERCDSRFVVRRGDSWDLESGYPLPLSAFFPNGVSVRKLLFSHAREEIERRLAAGTSVYRDNWEKNLRRQFSAENFYLTERGLCYFYQMYALAPAVEGTPIFCLPYGENGAVLPA